MKKEAKKSKKDKKEKKTKKKTNKSVKKPKTNDKNAFLQLLKKEPVPVMEALEEHGYIFPRYIRFDQDLGDALIEKHLLAIAHAIWSLDKPPEDISRNFSDFIREHNLPGYFSIIENDPLTGDIFF